MFIEVTGKGEAETKNRRQFVNINTVTRIETYADDRARLNFTDHSTLIVDEDAASLAGRFNNVGTINICGEPMGEVDIERLSRECGELRSE